MTGAWTADDISWVRQAAVSAGFDLAGVAATPAASDPAGTLVASRFAEWVKEGRAGEMAYLTRQNDQGELLRSSARNAMPWARSIVVCAFNYNGDGPRSIDPAMADQGWIARYAWNGKADGRAVDYHDDLMHRLRALEADLQRRLPCQSHCYVDTGPLLEREFAAQAGVGWTGKNTCVINQDTGSWLLLGVIVTSLDLPAAAALDLAPDRCGSCTRCIDACPTDALIAPRQMDASRCISYLTIELKGSIPEDLRKPIGRQVFGCDICQDVCPWNRRAPVVSRADLATRQELINPTIHSLAAMDEAEFRRQFEGSPLERTKLRRIQRNIAIAMGNSGEQTFLPKLAEWSRSADPVLAEAATWALNRLEAALAPQNTTAPLGNVRP